MTPGQDGCCELVQALNRFIFIFGADFKIVSVMELLRKINMLFSIVCCAVLLMFFSNITTPPVVELIPHSLYLYLWPLEIKVCYSSLR